MLPTYSAGPFGRGHGVALLTLAFVASACSDSTSPGPAVTTIDVTPPADTIEVGQTVSLQAEVRDRSGGIMVGQSVTWSSQEESVAAVSTSGVVTGVAPGGPVTITASSSGVSGSSEVLVRSDCTDSESIPLNASRSGQLSSTDCQLDDGSFVDLWTLELSSAARVRITMSSTDVDAYLGLASVISGEILAADDDSAGGTNARIEIDLAAGQYLILANSFDADETGTYILEVTEVAAPNASEWAPALGHRIPDAGADWGRQLGAKAVKR